ncbi:MAG: hypothetical protein WD396_04665, partial [Pseudohongiellaceae bacterium]
LRTVYASAPPAYNGNSLLGVGTFDNVTAFFGRRSDGLNVAEVDGGFTLDFSTGEVSELSMSVCFGSEGCLNSEQSWQLEIATLQATAGKGLFDNVEVTGTIYDSIEDTLPFTGNLSGFATTNTEGEWGFVLGYDFRNDGIQPADNIRQVIGAALIEGSVESSFTYDSAYRSAFSSFGFAISQGLPAIIVGNVAGSETTPRLISFSGDGGTFSGEPSTNGDPDYILETAGSATFVAGPAYVDWQEWGGEGSHTLFQNPTSVANYLETTVGDPLLVVTLPSYTPFTTTGTVTFNGASTLSSFTGMTSLQGYELDSLTGYFDLDLDSLAVSSGSMQLGLLNSGDTQKQTWEFEFSGNLSTMLNSDLMTVATYMDSFTIGDSRVLNNDGIETGASIAGEMTGFLAGDGEGSTSFAGGFSLSESLTSEWVQGAFLWHESEHMTAQEISGLESGTSYGMFVSGSPSTDQFSEVFGGPVHVGDNDNDPIFLVREFDPTAFDDEFDFLDESIIRSNNITRSASPGSKGVDIWGQWTNLPGGDPKDELFSVLEYNDSTGASNSDPEFNGGHDGYWFIADPSTAILPSGGTFRYNSVLSLQGTYSTSSGAGANPPDFFALDAASSSLRFDILFGSCDPICDIENGQFDLRTSDTGWTADFTGNLDGPFINITSFSNTVLEYESVALDLTSETTGEIQGYFTGSGVTDGEDNPTGTEGIALAFNLAVQEDTSDPLDETADVNHSIYGTVLLDGNGEEQIQTVDQGELTLPQPTTETHDITWGQWDNPVADNFVLVQEAGNGAMEVATDNYLATVNPTPVANLQGSASYGTTLASSFIGSGSAGDVTQVVAGMDVDFNSGAISNGLLQVEVAGSQAWAVDFAGTVNGGAVDLNALGGTLMDPGGVISNAVGADLGGVFTGTHAEAFVGGFEIVDQMNSLNHVEGLYTIEK